MILAIDQGTTGTTCLVFGEESEVRGRAYSEFGQHFPEPGLVEHDPDEIWETTRSVALEALAQAGTDGSSIDAIGITNQRETVVAWDRESGRPVHRALVWQDRRGASRCDELRAAGLEPTVRETTGLVLDPYFSATKIEWLLKNGNLPEQTVFGTVDSWLAFKLTGEHVTDASNASRTMLWDIHRKEWSPALCELFGIDPARMPTVLPSAGTVGFTGEFGGEVPVAGIAGDQQAALFGQACFEPGMAKNTYGTGSFVLINSGDRIPSSDGDTLATVAWQLGDQLTYASEASIFITGAAIQWLRDGLGIVGDAADSEALAASLDGNDGVYFVPALTGLGSPWWDPYARGTIVGLTRGTGRAHLARAALEAIAYQSVDAVRAQEEATGRPIESLRADGGAAANAWLMQFQADLLGVPVLVPDVTEVTAKGAASLARLGIAQTDLSRLAKDWHAGQTFEPQMERALAEELIAEWHRAVERSRDWASR